MQGKRLGEDIPPPHYHCFIRERNGTNHETNPINFSRRLSDDLCMMVNLEKALNWTIQYEQECFGNQLTTCLANVKYSVEAIIEGLSNITNISVTACESNGDLQNARENLGSEYDNIDDTTTYNGNGLYDNTKTVLVC